jgi:hypothetical protein
LVGSDDGCEVGLVGAKVGNGVGLSLSREGFEVG